MKSGILATAFVFSSLAMFSGNAFAAGFYIQEQSVKGLGYAFSGSVTSIDDASTIFFNPAGMSDLDRAQLNAGVHLIVPHSDLDNTGSTFLGAPVGGSDNGNPYDPSPVPNFFIAAPFADGRFWAGIGVTAPFGLGSDYGDDWFGRFDSTKTELTTIDVAPSISFKATDWLSIGAGVDFQYAEADLRSAVSNVASTGTSKLEGKDTSVGYNIGLKAEPVEGTTLGLHYRSAMKHTLDGRIIVEGLTAGNTDISGKANLNLPDIATFGIAQDITPDFRLMGQATWFGWANFESITAVNDAGATVSSVPQNYKTTWAFAIGAEYDVDETWTLRGGYQYDQTPTRDEFRTSRTPDGDRNWFSLGASYNFTPDLSLDVAATYIDVSEERIDVTRNSGLAQVRADTGGNVAIGAIGISYKF
jgi:long-chain fatty acid transport protein